MRNIPYPQDDQDLRESLGLDSVDVVGLVMRIEREFRVRLSPEELANVKVVGDLLDLMEGETGGSTGRPVRTVIAWRKARGALESVARLSRVGRRLASATIATPAVIRSVPAQRAMPTSSRR